MFCSHFRTKFRERFTKAVAMIVVALMFSLSISPATYAFAKANMTGQHQTNHSVHQICEIIPNSDDSISVKSGDEENIIKVHETYNTRTAVITDKKSGSNNKLILDKRSDTIFSTYTGKTIQISDDSQQGAQAAQKTLNHSRAKRSTEVELGPCRDGSAGCCKVERLPWRQIKNALGIASVTGVVGLAFTGLGIAATARTVIDKVSTILGGIGHFVPDDDDHGVAFRLCRKGSIRMNQWGSTFDVPTYEVVDSWRY